MRHPNFFALGGRPAAFKGPGDAATINRQSIHEEDRYLRLFSGVRSEHATGEASTLYLYSDRAAKAIHEAVPDARLIVLLRDPVRRAHSSYRHLIRDGREPAATFSEALEAEGARRRARWEHLWHYTEVGRYARQLARYYEIFDAEQIRVYVFEEFVAEPRRVLRSVFDHLGVSTGCEVSTDRVYNVSGTPRWRLLQALLNRSPAVRRVASTLFPRTVRSAVWATLSRWNTRPGAAILDGGVRDRLIELFEPEREELERLLDRRFTDWLDGANG
jgi:hypothetical protein